ncbi:hypothetical protein HS041_05465 [Planomonospora sp. ID67723]|uniref:hypothetical protein n=1 Tax=Planomonospora sp. ID67723 TaxID=2738134 RepID=UPI0018C3F694|nr:hypothetical protein [Planomonospora sp. ID67723]MBG0827208.1 hypothetical protein [Planomonospora sp. ID67723]
MSRFNFRPVAVSALATTLTFSALTFVAAPAEAAPSSTATAASAATAARPYAKITWQKRTRYGNPVTYNWRVTDSHQLAGSELVMYTRLNRKGISKIRITRKAPGGRCGVQKDGSDYNIYCILHNPEDWKKFYMSFKVWQRGYSSLIADHYWRAVDLGGGSIRDYTSLISRSDRIGRSTTKFYY